MQKVIRNKFVILTTIFILLALVFFSTDRQVGAADRPSLAGLEIQLANLQSQVDSMESTPFLGEIRAFAGNFAPVGWMSCEGQLISISQNPALFSLMGATYGGDGRTTFGLPDLRGRVAMGQGSGPGLTGRVPGQKIGAEIVVLSVNQMPQHGHVLQASSSGTNSTQASANLLAANPSTAIFKTSGTGNTATSSDSISLAGAGQPFSVIQPTQVLTYIIAVEGTYPQRP